MASCSTSVFPSSSHLAVTRRPLCPSYSRSLSLLSTPPPRSPTSPPQALQLLLLLLRVPGLVTGAVPSSPLPLPLPLPPTLTT